MNRKGLFFIHVAVILFGCSGLFVKLIQMPALLITLGRALFSAMSLYFFIHYRGDSLRLNKIRDYAWNILAGVLLTVHWFFFIMSIQVSSVSIGTITFATYPMFVFFMEPYMFKEKIQFKNLVSVIMIAIGIAFLIPAFEITNATTLGILYGLISSFSFAFLSVINRKLASKYDSVVITINEQTVATIIMTLIISVSNVKLGQGTALQFIALVIYGVLFTAVAHSLYVRGLTHVKAQTASVISVLEPVYSIFLAILFLQERLTYQEIIGTCFILLAVMISTLQYQYKGDSNENI